MNDNSPRANAARSGPGDADSDFIGSVQLARELGVCQHSVIRNLRDWACPERRGKSGAFLFSRSRVAREIRARGLLEVLDDYYTAPEFARELGIADGLFSYRKKRGEIPPPVIFFGRTRWPGRVVREFLKNAPAGLSRARDKRTRARAGLLSVDELAAYLSATRDRVEKLMKEGQIEADGLFGREYYFKRARVDLCLKRLGLWEVARDFFDTRDMTFLLKTNMDRLRRLIREGNVPAPLNFFGKKRWPRSQIREFLANKSAARNLK
ncbi:MAG: excisionase family DNA-binding protein [Desulfovibrio sp.]|nr:excisionase family DNA-binding protein [Desulfovibrio sp.]